jgi:hypothetical protein
MTLTARHTFRWHERAAKRAAPDPGTGSRLPAQARIRICDPADRVGVTARVDEAGTEGRVSSVKTERNRRRVNAKSTRARRSDANVRAWEEHGEVCTCQGRRGRAGRDRRGTRNAFVAN